MINILHFFKNTFILNDLIDNITIDRKEKTRNNELEFYIQNIPNWYGYNSREQKFTNGITLKLHIDKSNTQKHKYHFFPNGHNNKNTIIIQKYDDFCLCDE